MYTPTLVFNSPGTNQGDMRSFFSFIFNLVLVIQQPLYLYVTRLSTNTSSLRTRWLTKKAKNKRNENVCLWQNFYRKSQLAETSTEF